MIALERYYSTTAVYGRGGSRGAIGCPSGPISGFGSGFGLGGSGAGFGFGGGRLKGLYPGGLLFGAPGCSVFFGCHLFFPVDCFLGLWY